MTNEFDFICHYVIPAVILISIGFFSGDKGLFKFMLVGAFIPIGNLILLGLVLTFSFVALLGYLLEKIGL